MSDTPDTAALRDGPPDDYAETGTGMSNFDRSIDEGLEERLRTEKVLTRYAGWEFNGLVWFDGKEFACEVWRYQVPRETIRAESLPDLMVAVAEEWGWD